MKEEIKKYSVFVGGLEVNNYLLTLTKAKQLAQEYKEDNYTDVKILKY